MKIKPIRIGNISVGQGHKCYIIAEIGSNFDASFSKAKKLITLAKRCGADAVKFQTFRAEELISKNGFGKKVAFQSRWKKSVWDIYKEAEFPREWHKKLSIHARKNNIHFFTSPWDFEAVDMLMETNPPVIKIGSGDITYLEMLRYVGKKKKPIILATGASTLKEVKDAVREIKSTGNNQIILLHSVTQYPSDIKDANLLALQTLRKVFNLNVGYSDHSPGDLIALASVAIGACVIEKHFTDNPTLTGPDHPHSMDPKSFSNMIKKIRMLETALGNGDKIVTKSENETRIIQRRGIWTTKPIKKDEIFTKENIKALRPVNGIPASMMNKILGKKSKRDLKEYTALKSRDL